jgi:hypothetical protein
MILRDHGCDRGYRIKCLVPRFSTVCWRGPGYAQRVVALAVILIIIIIITIMHQP